jgi:hypothetical protein
VNAYHDKLWLDDYRIGVLIAQVKAFGGMKNPKTMSPFPWHKDRDKKRSKKKEQAEFRRNLLSTAEMVGKGKKGGGK